MRKYKVSLISLFTAFVLAIVAAVTLLTAHSPAAYAAATDRYVTVDGSNIFYTSIRGATVTYSTEEIVDDAGVKTENRYTTFKIGNDESVDYRKSLAYSWYTGVKDADGKLTGAYELKRFSMQIGFANLEFKRFIITFESQQYIKNKDDITRNYVVFVPSQEAGKVNVAVTQSLEEEIKDYPVSVSTANNSRITLSFAAFYDGDYTLQVEGSGATGSGLVLKNVYESYASYVASGDLAVTPLKFSAELKEGADASQTADMKLYDINGQSFEMFEHDSDGLYNDVKDTAAPVMCFNSTPSYVEYGKSLNFDYQVIDVLAASPRQTAYFYVLTGDQFDANDFEYSKTDYPEGDSASSGTDGEVDKAYSNPYTQVSSGSSIRIINDAETFIPGRYLQGGAEYDKNARVYGLIKIYYEISDVSGSSAKSDKVFIDWYAKDEALVNIYSEGYKNQAGKTENFLKIIDGKKGVTYARDTDTTLESYKQTIMDLTEIYQSEVERVISETKYDDETMEDGKLYAGSENHFYLPAYDLVSCDQYSVAQDYKYSIYYKAKTSGSNTSLQFNKMSMPLTEADVTYRFTVFVTDKFGNPMRYPKGNGEWGEITSEDVWNEENAELLPFFEFDVSYKEATSKNPETLPVAYVKTAYSGVSFKINGVSGTYNTKYDLYIFDRNGAFNNLGIDLTYSQFVENFDKLFNNTYDAAKNTRAYFKTVKPAADLKEGDENYDLFKAINWNSSSVNFTPQSVDDFYIVRLSLTDKRSGVSTTNFATVAASVQATPLKGESDWVQNNLVSIVLLSIAGACLIGFIVLLIVKPKQSGDIDEIYAAEKVNSKKKRK